MINRNELRIGNLINGGAVITGNTIGTVYVKALW